MADSSEYFAALNALQQTLLQRAERMAVGADHVRALVLWVDQAAPCVERYVLDETPPIAWEPLIGSIQVTRQDVDENWDDEPGAVSWQVLDLHRRVLPHVMSVLPPDDPIYPLPPIVQPTYATLPPGDPAGPVPRRKPAQPKPPKPAR